ncbi:MAG TPA: hypothetical protein ENO23_01295 [Alphaproteobacteria bacterium]|nr:hypothetical protein [Alphaproteobacteria bacterium]
MVIDATGVHYKELNEQIRAAVADGAKRIIVNNVLGQRYIGAGMMERVNIQLNGTPGNDLASFASGPTIVVHGNGQDGIGNTMSDGAVVIHGHAGDIVGHSMRGGEIFVREDVGYRSGIHMKAYKGKRPLVVVGGRAGDFLGEYMAGGTLIVLGLGAGDRSPVGRFVGTGIHGGAILIRGEVDEALLAKEAAVLPLDDGDERTLKHALDKFSRLFEIDRSEIDGEFIKLAPKSSRPYGQLYAY